MNLGKLSKRFRRELLANPKQAAVLAIVSLVALWFWSPLLMKWFNGKAKASIAKSEPVTPVEMMAKSEPQRSWFEIHRWRQADPLTRSASLAAEARDPFQLPKTMVAAQQADEGAGTEPARTATVEPQRLNLKLEAIAYSGSRRLAQINGLTVQENEELAMGNEGEEEDGVRSNATGRVVAIHRTEVLLEIGGQPVRLSLPPKLLGSGEVVKRVRTQ